MAGQARELVLLCGGPDLRRFLRAVEHVTAAPGPHTLTRLHTRWGIVRLGADPSIEEIAQVPGADAFVAHAQALGARSDRARERAEPSEQERESATRVLTEAAGRGYQVAARALQTSETKVEQ